MRTLQICSIYLTPNGYGNKIFFDVTVWVNLAMEAGFSETSANFHWTTPRIPEDIIIYSSLCEIPSVVFELHIVTPPYISSVTTQAFLYDFLYFPLPSPLLLSRHTCYRMIHRGRNLTPSLTNSQPQTCFVYILYYASYSHTKILSILRECTWYTETRNCLLVRGLIR